MLDNAQGRKDRLLDVYVNQGLDRDAYLCNLAEIQDDVEGAQRRLAELDAAPAQEPAAPVVRSFANTWSTLSVDVRRDVAGALLTGVGVRQDKTVEIRPRRGEAVTVTFTVVTL